MNQGLRVAAVAALAAVVSLAGGCNKLKAGDQLNKGVQQYKAAHYEQAIEHFKNAVDLDRKSTRLNSSHIQKSRMPSSA